MPVHQLKKSAEVLAHIHGHLRFLADAPHGTRQSLGLTSLCNPAPAAGIDGEGDAGSEYCQGFLVVPLAGEIEILKRATVDSAAALQQLFMLCGENSGECGAKRTTDVVRGIAGVGD